ncbi:MAG: class F sortase [Acidimicrobiaceae bacterium]|nr:class F sortase [Acidimicrobiaceae bacterium]
MGPSLIKPVGKVSLPSSGVVGPATSSALANSGKSASELTAKNLPSISSVSYVGAPVNRSTPIHLSIPQIGVSTALMQLGLNSDGSVQVPTNIAEAGWYKYDVTPGQKGSAVILGHVDNYKGPAVFFYLDHLSLGSRVFVTLESGRTLQFAVIGVRMYSKSNFPDQLVYGPRSYPALQLVTCGGVFDPATGHYLSNIVVFTALVKS